MATPRLILPITYLKTNANAVVCFDLSCEVEPLLSATEETLMNTPGVFTISINKCPFVSPVNVLAEELERKLGIDSASLRRKPPISGRTRTIAVIHRVKDTFERVDDVDYQLYDAFFTSRGQQVFETLRQAEPKGKKWAFSIRFRIPGSELSSSAMSGAIGRRRSPKRNGNVGSATLPIAPSIHRATAK